MAAKHMNGWQNGHRNGAKRRGPVFRAFERFVLSIGMSVMAFVIERRLLRALKTGTVQTAPRTAAAHVEFPVEDVDMPPREADLTTSRHEVVDQAGG
jgi:hypothetical protein